MQSCLDAAGAVLSYWFKRNKQNIPKFAIHTYIVRDFYKRSQNLDVKYTTLNDVNASTPFEYNRYIIE